MGMKTVLVNRRRLMIGDRFELPDDKERLMYEVAGSDLHAGLLIRRQKESWYGYMHVESGVVIGSYGDRVLKELTVIPPTVLMAESDLA